MTRIFVAILTAFAWLDGHAQSGLPKCTPTVLEDTRHCFGAFEDFIDGVIHIGGWRNGSPYGEGRLYGESGVIVRGNWKGWGQVVVDEDLWQYVSSTPKILMFVLPRSIRKEGSYRRAWTMIAQIKEDEDGVQSERVLNDFDCSKERVKILSWTTFSDKFGSGKVLNEWRDLGDWNYVAPGTPQETLFKLICNHKLTTQK